MTVQDLSVASSNNWPEPDKATVKRIRSSSKETLSHSNVKHNTRETDTKLEFTITSSCLVKSHYFKRHTCIDF
jgi:hypothetical protein